jgi:hypothetical protein
VTVGVKGAVLNIATILKAAGLCKGFYDFPWPLQATVEVDSWPRPLLEYLFL